MAEVAAAVGLFGFFGAVMALLAWQGARIRRRPRGAVEAFIGPMQEIGHPAGHRARLESETVEERVAETPAANRLSPTNHRRPAKQATGQATAASRARGGRRGTSAGG